MGRILNEVSDLQPAPPQILCESTGAARPWPLIEALSQDDRYCLRHFVVTVDALNLHRDFDDGRVLIGETNLGEDPALRCAAEILAEQILFASVIISDKGGHSASSRDRRPSSDFADLATASHHRVVVTCGAFAVPA